MSVKEENIRIVKVPLAVDQIKEFFVNKELLYLVNYKESDLGGAVFLTYLSNLDLPAEIFFEGCSYEEKEEVLKIYAKSRNIIKSDSLRFNMANVILTSRGIDTQDIFLDPLFDKKEVKRFLSENKELVDIWNQFIESSSLYALNTVKEHVEVDSIKEEFEVIEDASIIGANVVNMFSIPSFMELFLSTGYKFELKYYKHQFEEYMFRGNNLFSFYMNEFNTPFLFHLSMFEDKIGLKELAMLGFAARIMEEQSNEGNDG